MYDELKGFGREGVVSSSRYCPRICLEGQRKATKTLNREDNHCPGLAKIRNKHLLNASLEHYL
jgi:hypothetical protein